MNSHVRHLPFLWRKKQQFSSSYFYVDCNISIFFMFEPYLPDIYNNRVRIHIWWSSVLIWHDTMNLLALVCIVCVVCVLCVLCVSSACVYVYCVFLCVRVCVRKNPTLNSSTSCKHAHIIITIIIHQLQLSTVNRLTSSSSSRNYFHPRRLALWQKQYIN